MTRATAVPITPSVLAWALRESGYSKPELAEEIGVSIEVIDLWLDGADRPNLTQFAKLAEKLKRPTASFLLPNPPRVETPPVEFRHPPGPGRATLNPTERRYIREASRIQTAVSWVLREMGADPLSVPRITIRSNPEIAASGVRQNLGVSVRSQQEWRDGYHAFLCWRAALEESGILVFQLPMGPESCRGFSMWDKYAPAIAINTKWNPEARVFSLFHEYGHLITRTSSACLTTWEVRNEIREDPTERWCEKFSAAVLLPWEDVERFLLEHHPKLSGKSFRNLGTVRQIATRFKVSLRAAALRLIEKQTAGWDLYWQIPKRSEEKSSGGGGSGRRRPKIRLDQFGNRTRKLLFRAVEREILERHDLMDYLNISASDLDAFEKLS